ncbi:hypothetical protein L6452_27108 [Arctium lappa]|uniref:Uncharacterized protein n=1 Tax=Arctium lappa TaxID=4217 RepID=A0ACB8ZVV3_ARCLA|nr:hypothetical protein L6452_27108 [Arctium lappa]
MSLFHFPSSVLTKTNHQHLLHVSLCHHWEGRKLEVKEEGTGLSFIEEGRWSGGRRGKKPEKGRWRFFTGGRGVVGDTKEGEEEPSWATPRRRRRRICHRRRREGGVGGRRRWVRQGSNG